MVRLNPDVKKNRPVFQQEVISTVRVFHCPQCKAKSRCAQTVDRRVDKSISWPTMCAVAIVYRYQHGRYERNLDESWSAISRDV